MDEARAFPYTVHNPRLILHVTITPDRIIVRWGTDLIPFLVFIFYRFKLREKLFI